MNLKCRKSKRKVCVPWNRNFLSICQNLSKYSNAKRYMCLAKVGGYKYIKNLPSNKLHLKKCDIDFMFLLFHMGYMHCVQHIRLIRWRGLWNFNSVVTFYQQHLFIITIFVAFISCGAFCLFGEQMHCSVSFHSSPLLTQWICVILLCTTSIIIIKNILIFFFKEDKLNR